MFSLFSTEMKFCAFLNTKEQKLVLSFISFFLSSSSLIYPPPIWDLHPPGLTTQMPVGQMSVGGAIVCIKTLDRFTRAGLPECLVSIMLGPPLETEHTPNPRIGNRTRAAGLEGGDSTVHATATDQKSIYLIYFFTRELRLAKYLRISKLDR